MWRGKSKTWFKGLSIQAKKNNFFSEIKEENKSEERSSLAGQETADDIDDDNIEDDNIDDDNIEDENINDDNSDDDNIEEGDDDNFMQDLMDLKEEDFEEYDPG